MKRTILAIKILFMSSHHIVRDNQEPALLILETDQVPFEIVQELLEWSPFIIVHESQLDIVLHWGIKIDMILFYEGNRNEVIEKAATQFPLKLLPYQLQDSPLDIVLEFLKVGKYPSVNILTNNKKVFPYLFSLETSMDLVIIQEEVRWSLVRSGYFEKRIADEVVVYILENNSQVEIVTAVDGKVNISRNHPIWIGEKL